MSKLPLLAVTIGDPSGIGPEVSIRGALDAGVQAKARVLLVGAKAVVEQALARAQGLPPVRLVVVDQPEDVVEVGEDATLHILDTRSIESGEWVVGELSRAGGVASVRDTEEAVALALEGRVDAVVSGPVNKQGLQLADRHYPGQTEFIRDLTGAEQPLKILVGGRLRVAQSSSHMPLREAIATLTSDRVTTTAIKLAEALKSSWGLPHPRVAVSALNPHAGDNGLLGREEIDIINPGIAAAREQGYDIVGAVPSDVVFLQGEEGRYDGVVSLFHDQGTIPLKRLKFASAALGLPIIRTTPGHGTAYDIAKTGIADATAMINALNLAAELGSQRLLARS